MDVDRSSTDPILTTTAMAMAMAQKKSCRGRRKGGKDSLKVVYISSPMKVKTSASRFRSLVQELTGKNSDISEYIEGDGFAGAAATGFLEMGCEEDGATTAVLGDQEDQCSDHPRALSSSMNKFRQYSPASSDSFGRGEDVQEQFAGIFKSSFYYNPPQLDVLGSYDDLL